MLFQLVLGRVVLRFPPPGLFEGVGQILLVDKVAGVVVGILVVFAVVEFFHQLGGCVAQMQRDGQVAGFTHGGQSLVDGHVGRVALGRTGQVDSGLGHDDAAFGPPDVLHGIETGVGQQQGVGVGQAYIFRGRDNQPPGDEGGIFSSLDHACQPVDGRVGVAASYRFDESRYDVVVHLAVLVVGGRVLLQPFGYDGVVDDYCFVLAHGLRDEVDDVEQFAGIASRVSEEGVGLAHIEIPCF